MEVNDNYRAVAAYSLNKTVPDDIKIHFDTARNLYLYTWVVYRFYPVAEHHVLACLELALRERYEKEIPKRYYERAKFPTLKALLTFATDKGDVKSERFRRWHEAAEIRARTRHEYEMLEEMREEGLDQIEVDYSEVQVTDVDKNQDYIKDLIEFLRMFRNNYAHGSTMLHKHVLGTIQVVSEVINQIYPETGSVTE